MNMKFRKYFLPKNITDAATFVFILIMIPTTYWYEIFVVLPNTYSGGFWYYFHLICGTFLMIQTTSNLVAILTVDTSIRGEFLSISKKTKSKWHFCSICETIVPPRAWHCNVCDICILKRDHHCMFTGCCIGHMNLRYFLMFIFYMMISSIYATYFNIFFLLKHLDSFYPTLLLKLIFPLATIIFGIDISENQIYLLISMINIFGMFFLLTMLYYHGNLCAKGAVTYEYRHNKFDYNLGFKQNFKEVFGERWFLTWLFPTLYSKLPQNGINWHTKETWQLEAQKHK